MINRLYSYIKGLFLPCFILSALTGFFSAILITVFKIATEWVIEISSEVYEVVQSNPAWIFALVIVAGLIGLVASCILSISHSCRGGGIPTSVAAIQGIISFRWVSAIILLPVSALLTFLAGLPLGTEGPCVQMGTAVGDGVVRIFGSEKDKGWRRYIMTGGASAGFSVATVSPISAIIFSMEELHKRFSPMLLLVAILSVSTAQITMSALSNIGLGGAEFLSVPKVESIPLGLYFVPILLGCISGICAIFFTHLYHSIDRVTRSILEKFSVKIVFPILFAVMALVGVFFAGTLGSGHSLITSLLNPGTASYILILLFLMRSIGTILCNTSGVTGGIFLPTLAFGAIIGAFCANAVILFGWIEEKYYVLMVVLGIASFLGSTSRIPLTAIVFAVETLSGINNILPIAIATLIAFLIVEFSGLEDLTDKVIEAKLHKINKGKEFLDLDVSLTVNGDSFAVGKRVKDVLWPKYCNIVTVNQTEVLKNNLILSEGDVITVRCVACDLVAMMSELTDLVGVQAENIVQITTS